ncbi:MAG: universal stress protein [Actinomycetota bacterium]
MKVLVAVDGSEAADRAAKRFAESCEGSHDVRVLVVVSHSESPYITEDDSDRASRTQQLAEKVLKASAGTAETLRAAGHSVKITRRFGHPPDEIVGEMLDFEPDLVVMGRRGVKGVARWLGSVSEHVLHHADVPVLLVP